MSLIDAVRHVQVAKAKLDKLRAEVVQANQAFADAQKGLTRAALGHRFAVEFFKVEIDSPVVEDQAVS